MKQGKSIYLFMGPPGAGKGSLAQRCVEELGWKQLSTGNLCRKNINEGTKVGKEIDFFINSGKLVPDELISTMVDQWLKNETDEASAVILDGYPRTQSQADLLEDVLKEMDQWQLKIINLILNDEAVIDRLSRRFICKNTECQAVYSLDPNCMALADRCIVCDICNESLCRRKDDAPESVRERLVIYHRHADSLLTFYQDKGYVINNLAVNKPLAEVFNEFKRLMGF